MNKMAIKQMKKGFPEEFGEPYEINTTVKESFVNK